MNGDCLRRAAAPSADHAGAQVTRARLLPVEALNEQCVASRDRDDLALRCRQAALASQHEHAVFHPCVVPLVVGAVELGDPEALAVLDHGFRPGTAHRGADEQQLFDLPGDGIGCNLFLIHQGIGDRPQPRQIECLVEVAASCRRLRAQAEAECSGAVVGRMEQKVEFTPLRAADVALDHPPSPIVRASVAQCAEHAVHGGRLVSPRREPQFDRIEFVAHHVGAEVHRTVAKTTGDRRAGVEPRQLLRLPSGAFSRAGIIQAREPPEARAFPSGKFL